MLSEEIQEKLTERLIDRIEKQNEYILNEIGNSIKKIGTLTPTKAQQLAQILKYGGSYNKILNKIAQITNMNVKDIYKIFDAVAKDNQEFARKFYEYRGIDFIPYEKNIALQNQVRAIADITAQQYINLSNTTAIGFTVKDMYGNSIFKGLQKAYYDAIDEAVLSVGQGKDTFQNQMYKTIKELGTSGIKTIEFGTGYKRRMDSQVRMNMMGALRDLSNTLQEQFGKEYGADGIEISVHESPAPDHAPIQGHQFTMEEFEKMQNSLPFKDYSGKQYKAIDRHISEWNCYHYEFSVVLGINEPEYDKNELQAILNANNNGFDLDGKHYTKYQGSQMQRQIETEVRKQKDLQILARASGQDEIAGNAQIKINQLTNKYKELSDASGLDTKMERMRVSGYHKIEPEEKSILNYLTKGSAVREAKRIAKLNESVNVCVQVSERISSISNKLKPAKVGVYMNGEFKSTDHYMIKFKNVLYDYTGDQYLMKPSDANNYLKYVRLNKYYDIGNGFYSTDKNLKDKINILNINDYIELRKNKKIVTYKDE